MVLVGLLGQCSDFLYFEIGTFSIMGVGTAEGFRNSEEDSFVTGS